MALPVDLLLSRTELPQDGARLNPAHPLAGRFVTAYLPGVSSDNLGFGGPGGITGHAHSRSAIPAGPALRFSGSGANATTSRSFGPTPSYPLTMVVVCRQGSNTNGAIAAIAASSAIGGSYWYIGGGSSSQISLSARNNFGSTIAMLAAVPVDANGNQAIGQDLVIVAQSLSASDHRLCVNGSAIVTATTNIGSMVAWDRLFLGQTSGTTSLDVAAVLFAHGGTALTDVQMRQLSSHPREVWEMFEPQRIWVPVAAAGGGGAQDVAIAQTTEIDLAQALTVISGAVSLPIAQASETDTAQALTAQTAITVAIGQVTETDTAQALTPIVAGATAIGQASEVDSAQPLTVATSLTVSIGQVSELDTAQPLTAANGSTTALGQVVETDTAQALTAVLGAVTVALGQAEETDSALTLTVGGTVIPPPSWGSGASGGGGGRELKELTKKWVEAVAVERGVAPPVSLASSKPTAKKPAVAQTPSETPQAAPAASLATVSASQVPEALLTATSRLEALVAALQTELHQLRQQNTRAAEVEDERQAIKLLLG